MQNSFVWHVTLHKSDRSLKHGPATSGRGSDLESVEDERQGGA